RKFCEIDAPLGAGFLRPVALLAATLARQRCWIFVYALAESALHPSGKPDRRFTKLVAQTIRRGQRLLPALVARRLQQSKLGGSRTRIEIRRLHSQQPYRRAWFPVVEKQTPHLLENLIVHLRRPVQRMGSRDGGEIFVAQFQLQRTREVSAFAQPAAHHLTEPHQRGLQALGIARIFVESMLVADRFGIDIFSNFIVEPSTRILTA